MMKVKAEPAAGDGMAVRRGEYQPALGNSSGDDRRECDRWCHVTLVIDFATRGASGWRLSKSGNTATAEAAPEDALIQRFGHLGRVPGPLQLR